MRFTEFNKVAQLQIEEIPEEFTDINGVAHALDYVLATEAELSGKMLSENIKPTTVAQIEKLMSLGVNNPKVGKDYIPVFVLYISEDVIRLYGSSVPLELQQITNQDGLTLYDFGKGKQYPNKRLSKLSYSQLFMFDNASNFDKFINLMSLRFNTARLEETTKKPSQPSSARIQHAEDVVFWEGTKGAQRVLDSLLNLEHGGHEDVTVKWDGCIHPDSIVQTNLGKMRIEDVIDAVNYSSIALLVLQYNFDTHSAEMAPVLNAVKQQGSKRWVKVQLADSSTLTLTQDHEVYTSNRGWVAATELTQQDSVQSLASNHSAASPVVDVEQLDSKYLQCDITTATENFFVFNNTTGYLIHNSPAIVFGRDSNGDFTLTDKSGFIAKGYDGKPKSADQLKNMFLNRAGGKNRDNPKYVEFATKMASIFDQYQRAVPKEARGYFKGDLLYYTTPQLKNDHYVFQPNVVEYSVDSSSELGQKISHSKTGVVIHRQVDASGNQVSMDSTDKFQGKDVLVVPPVAVATAPTVDRNSISQLAEFISKQSTAIDQLLDVTTLTDRKLKKLPSVFYTYTNSKVDTGLESLGDDFAEWVSTAKLSEAAKQKILDYIQENQQGLAALWTVVKTIQQVKDDIIQQLDQQAIVVKQSMSGQAGGEGYVLAHPAGDIKLVPRQTFSRINRAIQR